MKSSARIAFARTLLLLTALFFSGLGPQLRALTINLTYDSTVTSLSNAAAYEAATNYAAQQLESIFTNNITINITVTAVTGTGTFGESQFDLVGSSYFQVRSKLNSHATSANDIASLGDLPGTDPTGGGTFFVNRAEAKVLGIIGASNATDGTFFFGTGFNFALYPADSSRAINGEYDFVGVAMHEMTEIMGRASGLGTDFGNGLANYIPYDLFRYSAAGAHNLTPGVTSYFSIDNGTTNLKAYNSLNDGSDPQDWAQGTNDACNNAAFPGVVNAFTAVDIETMDVMGYTVAAVPSFTNGSPTTTATVSTPYSFTYNPSSTGTFAVATGSLPPGLGLTSAGVLSGTPTTAGTYNGTITVSNGVGSATQNFSIVVNPAAVTPVAFNQWAALYFTTTQLADATISGQSATPQGDGVPNLLKYLADIDPSRPMTAADRAALPIVTFANSGATMILTYHVYNLQTGFTLTPQQSTDLVNWSATIAATQVGSDANTTFMQVQVATSGLQFIRLRVTSP